MNPYQGLLEPIQVQVRPSSLVRMKKGKEQKRRGTRVPAQISIVDDDPSIREATMDLMQSAGFKADAFASAEHFLASPRLLDTDCLILDVRMEGMDGMELQRQLRAKGSHIPVIFITAHSDEQVRARALREGATAFLRKPFSSQELLLAVRSSLGGV